MGEIADQHIHQKKRSRKRSFIVACKGWCLLACTTMAPRPSAAFGNILGKHEEPIASLHMLDGHVTHNNHNSSGSNLTSSYTNSNTTTGNVQLRMSSKLCYFIGSKYRCRDRETTMWNSCCSTGTCRGFCGSGTLPPNSQTLFLGNSHIRELSEATICQNIDHLDTVRYSTYSEMLGRNASIYPYIDGVLRDTHGNLVSGDSAELSEFTFKNGAVMYTIVNHPLQHSPIWPEDNYTYIHMLHTMGNAMGLLWGDLTGIVFNSGNHRKWANKRWCKDKIDNPTVCNYIDGEVKNGHEGTKLIQPQMFLDALDTLNFTGNAVLTTMMSQIPKVPEAEVFQNRHPYKLTYISADDYTLSKYALREEIGEHPCLPGPPDDGAHMVMYSLYQS